MNELVKFSHQACVISKRGFWELVGKELRCRVMTLPYSSDSPAVIEILDDVEEPPR